MKRMLAAVLLTACAVIAPGEANAAGEAVDVKAPDGKNLRGTLYSAGGEGPGVLLLHQCDRDRTAWESLAVRLAARGIHVMTMDYRGYGDSFGGGASRSEIERLRTRWPEDVEAAYEFLKARPEVDGSRIAVGGASCGVNQSVVLATKHPEIHALVLLSGGIRTQEGWSHIRDTRSLAVFGAASLEDERAARAIERIVSSSKNSSSILILLEGAGHGVPMFEKDKKLEPRIVDWLAARLAKEKAE